jgi:hypothetical protein
VYRRSEQGENHHIRKPAVGNGSAGCWSRARDATPTLFLLTLSLGYNVFWTSDVLRASNQISGVGAPTLQQSDLLAQGVTLSAKVKFWFDAAIAIAANDGGPRG